MKTIGVIANRDKDKTLKYTKILIESITEKGGVAKVTSDVAVELGLENESLQEEDIFNVSDVVICLGGDGTFLRIARENFDKNIPLLGVNLGTMGFLTEIEKSEIGSAVSLILKDEYKIEDRMMLEATIFDGENIVAKEVALNDVVVSRVALSRILHLKTYINDEFVDTFPGDGVIVSSPTGSTGYSISAGGPIVEPDVKMIIITPICPHILNSRPIITTGSRVVRIEVDPNYCHNAMVTIDGQVGYEIRGGYRLEIKRAEQSVKFMKVTSRDFFNILRTKIYGRGEK